MSFYPWNKPPAAVTPTTGGTQSNIAAMPDLTSLANEINALNRAAQSAALAARVPQATALETKSSQNIADELAGNVPSDVIDLLGQQAAERGVARGIAGSQNTNAAYLRALGLTSLAQKERGQQNLTAALARNPQAPLFDVTSQLITPYQQALLDFQKEQLKQQYELEQQRLANQRSLAILSPRSTGSYGGYGGGPSVYGGGGTGGSGATAGAVFGGGDLGRYTGVPGRYPGYPMGFPSPTTYAPSGGASDLVFDWFTGGDWGPGGQFFPYPDLWGGGGNVWSDLDAAYFGE